ncbi:MAG TPA: sigma-70 family RNA polymerase sigma factor [Gemmataceae bacterium]|nr:sigma-70 family RNA polymerase sigma factor [Gemmataceae bacterium]
MTDFARRALLYHFCRMQMPGVVLAPEAVGRHLDRTFAVYRAKVPDAEFTAYLDSLYCLDWYLCCACLERDGRAWELLFAARTGRSDCLLVDALRARAARLYPRDDERQDSAVTEFWSQLLVSESAGASPVLARYDGQRPLVPWLIRVFQNAHISRLRTAAGVHPLPEDDVALPLPDRGNGRWHEAFCLAARESLHGLADGELLILGLRLRYRMSQREVAQLLGVHEGTISRQTDKLRDRCLEQISRRLVAQGWTGDDLTEYILTEMGPLLLDEPRLGADRLASLLAARGRSLPATAAAES